MENKREMMNLGDIKCLFKAAVFVPTYPTTFTPAWFTFTVSAFGQ